MIDSNKNFEVNSLHNGNSYFYKADDFKHYSYYKHLYKNYAFIFEILNHEKL